MNFFYKFAQTLFLGGFGLAHIATAISTKHTIGSVEINAAIAATGVGSTTVEVVGSNSGSGVWIAPNWVLTAGHVAEGGTLSIRQHNETFSVQRTVLHPDWTANPATGLTQGSDLALLYVPGRTDTAAYSFLNTTSELPSQPTLIVGYGRTGNGLTGALFQENELSIAFNQVERRISAGNGFLWVTDFDSGSVTHNTLNAATTATFFYNDGFINPLLTDAVLAGGTSTLNLPTGFFEGTTARGDSGGPLFFFDSTIGEWTLVGITSWGTNPLYPSGGTRNASLYGDLSFYTEVGSHTEWINSVVPETKHFALTLALIVNFYFFINRKSK